jgi:hypothetical protein
MGGKETWYLGVAEPNEGQELDDEAAPFQGS